MHACQYQSCKPTYMNALPGKLSYARSIKAWRQIRTCICQANSHSIMSCQISSQAQLNRVCTNQHYTRMLHMLTNGHHTVGCHLWRLNLYHHHLVYFHVVTHGHNKCSPTLSIWGYNTRMKTLEKQLSMAQPIIIIRRRADRKLI